MKSPSWVAIIDDDASIRVAVSRLLRCNGIRVRAFASTDEYLSSPLDTEPSCILLDIHLQGGANGLELLDRFESTDDGPSVVLMTGAETVPATSEARLSHVMDYLHKPFDPSVLVAVVQEHVEQSAAPV